MEIIENEYIKPPTIDMINVIGTLSTPINLKLYFDKFIPNDNIIGAQLKQEKKGDIPPIKKNKKNPSKKSFYNQITFYVNYNKCFKVKIFNSGKVQIPGCKTINDAEIVIFYIAEKIFEDINDDDNDDICNLYELIPQIYKNNMMINMQYILNLNNNIINREILLFKILKEHKIFVKYNPNRYPGVIVPYKPLNNEKKVSIIIQASGKIAMKGSNSMKVNMLAHDFINKIILEHIEELKNTKNKIDN